MSLLGARVLAVVPARGGSRGIPRKNLRELGGRSLVARVGEVVAELSWIDRTVLSTDDDEIAGEGEKAGLAVPFRRPAALAGDRATAVDTWRHTWTSAEDHFVERYDVSVLLEPTSPSRRASDVEAGVRLLIERGVDSVVSVSRAPAHYTPERSFKIEAGGLLVPAQADGLRFTARQMVPAYFYRNGVVYAVTAESLIERGELMEGRCLPLETRRPVVNIDTPLDLAFAEFLESHPEFGEEGAR